MILPLLLLASTAFAQELCNQETPRSCECSSCWDDLPLSGAINWITVETDGCGAIDELAMRTKLASWSTEECGSSVHCGIRLPIAPEQILLGRLSCDAATRAGAISLAVMTGPDGKDVLKQDSFLPARLLGAILHSREHLLAIALRAHLTSVSITRITAPLRIRTSTTPPHTTTVPISTTTEATSLRPRLFFIPTSSLGIGLSVGCFATAIIALIAYGVWGRIEWKRLVEGRWKRKVYRKVPDVMFRSADEMPTMLPTVIPNRNPTVIPHSTSAYSTTQLIRY
ncbi:hypothetical protein PMAYCL1PPCAC_00005 [Pristionchus mayeri]|uniref:Uncharacterized protein n=1 Tax=Pristionchus mayeri TaxID=1317129 RepID=A0AAN5C3Y5_9BILA|nr:hypothetical protein PMAYCL1PPCAC_00005 [Pristionchus mayeri]